ncbi:hypothetical protein, partial [Pantoea eucalypti]
NPPLRGIPAARPEIPHPLSGSDGLLPRFISSFCVGYVIAVSLKDYLRLSAWQEEWPSTLADISYFCVGYVIAVSLKDYLRLSA